MSEGMDELQIIQTAIVLIWFGTGLIFFLTMIYEYFNKGPGSFWCAVGFHSWTDWQHYTSWAPGRLIDHQWKERHCLLCFHSQRKQL